MKKKYQTELSGLEYLLKEVAKIVGNFLHEKGGLSNGYLTWVDGCIQPKVIGGLEVSTPLSDDVTGKTKKAWARELEDTLLSFIEDQGYDYHIRFTKQHIEHGCFQTHISLEISTSIWGAKEPERVREKADFFHD